MLCLRSCCSNDRSGKDSLSAAPLGAAGLRLGDGAGCVRGRMTPFINSLLNFSTNVADPSKSSLYLGSVCAAGVDPSAIWWKTFKVEVLSTLAVFAYVFPTSGVGWVGTLLVSGSNAQSLPTRNAHQPICWKYLTQGWVCFSVSALHPGYSFATTDTPTMWRRNANAWPMSCKSTRTEARFQKVFIQEQSQR